jgi:hypothetical protein
MELTVICIIIAETSVQSNALLGVTLGQHQHRRIHATYHLYLFV